MNANLRESIGSCELRDDMMVNMSAITSRVFASVCLPVVGFPGSAQPWEPGPLPVTLPDGEVVDTARRSTYFRPRAASMLYGTNASDARRRLHLLISEPTVGDTVVVGVELLEIPTWGMHSSEPFWLVSLHLELSADDPICGLAAWVHTEPDTPAGREMRQRLESLIGPELQVRSGWRRAQSLCLVEPGVALSTPVGAPASWDPLTAWLWQSASTTTFDHFVPDTDDPNLLDGMLYLSSAWRALVLRDGASFVLRGEAGTFSRQARAYFQTIYTDVLQLAMLQTVCLDTFADHLSAIGNRFTKAHELRVLVNALTEYRNVLWWEDITAHGVGNELLRGMHQARRTSELFDRVTSDLETFREQVETQATQELSASTQADEERSRRFERFASVTAIAFALPLLVLTAMLLPIEGVTAGDHAFSLWFVLVFSGGLVAAGALAGTIVSAVLGRVRARRAATE